MNLWRRFGLWLQLVLASILCGFLAVAFLYAKPMQGYMLVPFVAFLCALWIRSLLMMVNSRRESRRNLAVGHDAVLIFQAPAWQRNLWILSWILIALYVPLILILPFIYALGGLRSAGHWALALVFLALLALPFLVVVFRMTRKLRSALLLAPTGLDYPVFACGPIAWSDIGGTFVRAFKGQLPHVVLKVGKIDEYLTRGLRLGWWLKFLYRTFGYNPLHLVPDHLGTTSEALRQAIEIRRRAFGQAPRQETNKGAPGGTVTRG